MSIGSYIQTWRRMRLRFYVAGTVGFLIAIFNLLIIRPKQPLPSLLALLGTNAFLIVLLVAWVWWFSCPRCGRNFFFSWRRFRLFSCVNCGLSLGAAQDPSNPD
jgi:hypothetical protein